MTDITINEVRERILSKNPEDADALNCIANLVGLPEPAEIPRPGTVVSWTFDEWKAWGAPYGFTKEDRSKHCYVVVHDRLPALRISKASTSSDVRSGLNLGAEVRRLIVSELRFLRNMATCLLSKYPDASLADLVASLLSAEDRKEWLPHILQLRSAVVDAKAEQLGKQLSGYLTVLSRYDVTPKIALLRAGVEQDDIERMLTVLKSNLVPKMPNLEDIVECLRDQVDNERDLAAAAEEAKAQARVTETAKPAVEEVDKAEILFNAETSRGKTRMISAVKGFHERVGQLANAAKGLSEALETSLFPNFPTDRFRELKAEAKQANAKLAEAVAANDVLETAAKVLQDRIALLDSTVAELQHEKAETEKLFNEAAVGPEWKAACIKLVAKLEPMVASNDFLAVAQGVAAARVVLADAKKAIDAGVSPTLV
jgi:hypothetical protein